MRPDGQCRSCDAPVRWAVSRTTGKRLPLDPAPTPNGNLGIVEAYQQDGQPMSTPVVAVNPTRALTNYRYLSHFVTCPNADDHRSKR